MMYTDKVSRENNRGDVDAPHLSGGMATRLEVNAYRADLQRIAAILRAIRYMTEHQVSNNEELTA